ncbi:helix-turn-helix domain-containing protein [Pararhodospirillum photometricum]|uniref:helix-turn-helix domain-containing protein n=1 Tax=Pararhodospirillum photometricum TaxID=1084 RepID=UPI00031BAC48|nr:helix-turn-helix domain-containing protein [Pararhodospirillum photometricum]
MRSAPPLPPALRQDASQQEGILGHLERGGALSQAEARRLYGCSRLAARVWDLKQAGYPVRSRMVRDPDGRLVAEYFIEPGERGGG